VIGVPIDGPCHVKARDLLVVRNSSQPKGSLKEKLNVIAFHYMRVHAAARISVQYWPTDTNLTDMLT